MPLLYGGGFPIEARQLMISARALLADLTWNRLRTGVELVENPSRALAQIVDATAR